MEGRELVLQQVAGAEEDEPAHADQVVGVRMQHHGRHLALLVARHVHAPLHAQGRQLVVFLTLRSGACFRYYYSYYTYSAIHKSADC